jgi:ubiquitin carboxyl-terminal hydrolase 34
MIAALIPKAVLLPLQCEETFHLASNLFKRLVDTAVDSMKLDVLVNQWGGLLLSHTCIEVGV